MLLSLTAGAQAAIAPSSRVRRSSSIRCSTSNGSLSHRWSSAPSASPRAWDALLSASPAARQQGDDEITPAPRILPTIFTSASTGRSFGTTSSGPNGARLEAGTSNQTLPPAQTMAVSAVSSRKVVPPLTETEKVLPLRFLNKTRTGRSCSGLLGGGGFSPGFSTFLTTGSSKSAAPAGAGASPSAGARSVVGSTSMAGEELASWIVGELVCSAFCARPRIGPVHPKCTRLATVEDLATPPPRDLPPFMRALRRRLAPRVLTMRGAAARYSS
mmetsp:Transcript_16890/g.55421  ORF Transcript_16890/g.55421 Transcript_16890/m.55421 type:complete len:272 (+) Transcript_16890:4538-5353(+)